MFLVGTFLNVDSERRDMADTYESIPDCEVTSNIRAYLGQSRTYGESSTTFYMQVCKRESR